MKRTIILSGILFACLVTAYGQEGVSVEKIRKHLHTLASDSLKGRGFGTPEGLAAANYIASQYENAGIAPLNGTYLYPISYRSGVLNISGNNVLGYIEGSDPNLKDEYIIISAHYDHLGWETEDEETVIYYGADDNASGTSTIIELGRVLAANRDKLGRSIIVAAYDGEESGLIGSHWFADHPPVNIAKIAGVVNFDMVGMYTSHKGVDLDGIELFAGYTELLDAMREDHSLEIKNVNTKVEQRTDTAPFGDLRIPSVAVNTGLESPYHKPEDQADLIDYEGIGIIADAMAGMITTISGETVVVADNVNWNRTKGDASAGNFALGIRYNIGSGQQIYVDEFYKGKNITAMDLGFFMRIRLSQALTLQPEVQLSRKGSQHTDGKFLIDAVTVPLNLLLTTPDPNGNGFRMFLLAGGYYSYFLRARIDGTPVDFTNTYQQYDYGFNAGIGLEIKNFQGGLYITRGLSGIMQDPADGTVLNRTVTFMTGWAF